MSANFRHRWVELGAIAVLAASATTVASPTPSDLLYELQDLGSLGGPSARAVGMNQDGTAIVGWAHAGKRQAVHAFLWTEKTGMVDLGTLGGPWAEARDVNNLGQVVGASLTRDDELHAFYAFGGVVYDLNDLLPVIPPADVTRDFGMTRQFGGGAVVGSPAGSSADDCSRPFVRFAEAMAINNDGVIVGCGYVLGLESLHGFALLPLDDALPVPSYGYVDLGMLPLAEDCVPYDVNDLGQIVGASGGHAFLRGKQMEPLDDIARLVMWQSQANAINNAGTAVGWYVEGLPQTACSWSEGVRVDLVLEPGRAAAANGINELDQVVGSSERFLFDGDVLVCVAVLWEGGEAFDLNEVTAIPVFEYAGFPWSRLDEAVGVDMYGRIAGYGSSTDGRLRSFMLVPLSMD